MRTNRGDLRGESPPGLLPMATYKPQPSQIHGKSTTSRPAPGPSSQTYEVFMRLFFFFLLLKFQLFLMVWCGGVVVVVVVYPNLFGFWP